MKYWGAHVSTQVRHTTRAQALESAFPEYKPMLPAASDPHAPRVTPLLRLERQVFSSWFRWLVSPSRFGELFRSLSQSLHSPSARPLLSWSCRLEDHVLDTSCLIRHDLAPNIVLRTSCFKNVCSYFLHVRIQMIAHARIQNISAAHCPDIAV